MDILCPTVTYRLNPPQQGIHHVILSCKTPEGDLFRVTLKDENDQFIGEPDRFVQFRIGSRAVEVNRPKNLVITCYSELPRLLYHDLIESIFKQYVEDHVPKVQQLEEVFEFPVTAEDVISMLNKEIEQLIKDSISMEGTDLGNGHRYFYASYDMNIEMDERKKLIDQLNPYGLRVDFSCDDLHIRVHGRPDDTLMGTKIGKAVNKYMDQWEPAHTAMLLAQSQIKE